MNVQRYLQKIPPKAAFGHNTLHDTQPVKTNADLLMRTIHYENIGTIEIESESDPFNRPSPYIEHKRKDGSTLRYNINIEENTIEDLCIILSILDSLKLICYNFTIVNDNKAHGWGDGICVNDIKNCIIVIDRIGISVVLNLDDRSNNPLYENRCVFKHSDPQSIEKVHDYIMVHEEKRKKILEIWKS